MTELFALKRNVIWLYAARFGNMWWGYNSDSAAILDKIYADFTKRRDISNGNYKVNNGDTISDDVEDKSEEILSYVINVDGGKFYIDFDHMQQINCSDENKKRGIKRVVIDSQMTEDEIMEFLKSNHHMKGIAGVLWKDLKN